MSDIQHIWSDQQTFAARLFLTASRTYCGLKILPDTGVGSDDPDAPLCEICMDGAGWDEDLRQRYEDGTPVIDYS